ncbi:hypothetical protein Purlil1_2515 [Purpureocillium lilacinum]|uniref:C2H2-type domain-containing protein n=1 Tax=Purpureocillium lilacinum TaxID=33203 RepID=A0ABR0CAF1_PURLI|nr:hypothetical protein Purlil1_2515 [Purpureocillium lilacinum]
MPLCPPPLPWLQSKVQHEAGTVPAESPKVTGWTGTEQYEYKYEPKDLLPVLYLATYYVQCSGHLHCGWFSCLAGLLWLLLPVVDWASRTFQVADCPWSAKYGDKAAGTPLKLRGYPAQNTTQTETRTTPPLRLTSTTLTPSTTMQRNCPIWTCRCRCSTATCAAVSHLRMHVPDPCDNVPAAAVTPELNRAARYSERHSAPSATRRALIDADSFLQRSGGPQPLVQKPANHDLVKGLDISASTRPHTARPSVPSTSLSQPPVALDGFPWPPMASRSLLSPPRRPSIWPGEVTCQSDGPGGTATLSASLLDGSPPRVQPGELLSAACSQSRREPRIGCRRLRRCIRHQSSPRGALRLLHLRCFPSTRAAMDRLTMFCAASTK